MARNSAHQVVQTTAAPADSTDGTQPWLQRNEGRDYLQVFTEHATWVFPLPPSGTVILDRNGAGDLHLQDPRVSNPHAKLVLGPQQVTIADLGSRAGTTVNDQRLPVGEAPPTPVRGGSVIRLGPVTLILHCAPRLVAAPGRGGESAVMAAVTQALAGRRGFGLLRVHADSALLRGGEKTLHRHLLAGERVVAGSDPACLWVFLPDASAATGRAETLLGALSGAAPSAKVGLALCPWDGIDGQVLRQGATDAAQRAQPGQVLAAADAYDAPRFGDQVLIHADPKMVEALRVLGALANMDLPVLLQGESGTGKEVAAAALHHRSQRQGGLTAENCATIQPALAESLLFGHKKGAFSGADKDHIGLFEKAGEGTLFLDEIGELPLLVQAKLLRALEQRSFSRLGDPGTLRPLRARLVFATCRDLEAMCERGEFRTDLFHRISGCPVHIPTLQERARDLPILIRHFLSKSPVAATAARLGQVRSSTPARLDLSEEAMWSLLSYRWPGNIRELRNEIERLSATIADPTRPVRVEHLKPAIRDQRPPAAPAAPASSAPVSVPAPATPELPLTPIQREIEELLRTRMLQALEQNGWVIYKAAAALGMSTRDFQRKMRAFGLVKPRG